MAEPRRSAEKTIENNVEAKIRDEAAGQESQSSPASTATPNLLNQNLAASPLAATFPFNGGGGILGAGGLRHGLSLASNTLFSGPFLRAQISELMQRDFAHGMHQQIPALRTRLGVGSTIGSLNYLHPSLIPGMDMQAVASREQNLTSSLLLARALAETGCSNAHTQRKNTSSEEAATPKKTNTPISDTSPPEEAVSRERSESVSDNPSSEIGVKQEPFPEKLHRLLREAEKEGNSHIASFTSDGLGFQIHKEEDFFQKIVRRYFNQTRLSSFKRQLNLYGFEMICSGPFRGGYSNRQFVRDKPELCRFIRRRDVKLNSKNRPARRAGEPEAPDFYSMPPISTSEEAKARTGGYYPPAGIITNGGLTFQRFQQL